MPNDLVIRHSARRSLLFAALVGAAAVIALPFVCAGDAVPQAAGAIWLGLCASACVGLLERAARRRPIVKIDALGLFDARLIPRPIEWWEIESFYPVDPDRSQVVELRLRHPRRTLAGAPWHVRLGLDWPRRLDLPHVCVSLLLLEGGVADVVAAIRRHAPYLAAQVTPAPNRLACPPRAVRGHRETEIELKK
jgi:hypothetical protein